MLYLDQNPKNFYSLYLVVIFLKSLLIPKSPLLPYSYLPSSPIIPQAGVRETALFTFTSRSTICNPSHELRISCCLHSSTTHLQVRMGLPPQTESFPTLLLPSSELFSCCYFQLQAFTYLNLVLFLYFKFSNYSH